MGRNSSHKKEGFLGAIREVTSPTPNKIQSGGSLGPAAGARSGESVDTEQSGKNYGNQSGIRPELILRNSSGTAHLSGAERKPIDSSDNQSDIPIKSELQTKAGNQDGYVGPDRPDGLSSIQNSQTAARQETQNGKYSAQATEGAEKFFDLQKLRPKDTEYLVESLYNLVSERLNRLPAESLCSPDPGVVGPVVDLLRYRSHETETLELCANLIYMAMNRTTARFAHPGFVSVLRDLTSDEIKVLAYFHRVRVIPIVDIKKVMSERNSEIRLNTLVSTVAVDAGCRHEDLAESYLANLERIGLLEIPRDTQLTDEKVYDRILGSAPVREKLKSLSRGGNAYQGRVVKYYGKLSVYGLQFSSACLAPG